MEARLLTLETTGSPKSANSLTWFIANGTGLPISSAQIPTSPPPLFTEENTNRGLIEFFTAKLAQSVFAVEEHGWSKWLLSKLFK